MYIIYIKSSNTCSYISKGSRETTLFESLAMNNDFLGKAKNFPFSRKKFSSSSPSTSDALYFSFAAVNNTHMVWRNGVTMNWMVVSQQISSCNNRAILHVNNHFFCSSCYENIIVIYNCYNFKITTLSNVIFYNTCTLYMQTITYITIFTGYELNEHISFIKDI